MLLQRQGAKPPFVAAGLLLFIIPIYLIFFARTPAFKIETARFIPLLGKNGVAETEIPLQESIDTQEETANTTDYPPAFNEEAHTLLAADDFLPHFHAVTQMKGMSMKQAKETCQWKEIGKVNFQYGEPSDWVIKDRTEEELQFRRNQWHHFINHEMLPWETYKNRFQGRGIVILAGNGRSLKRVKVILRQLKKLNSQLPIEFHFWGDEFSPSSQKEMQEMWPEVYFNDLSLDTNLFKSNNDNFFHVNYQLKTAAVLNSRFAELLLLDSDNIPVLDPTSLFESETFKEYGSLFWPDIARTRPENPIWAITNTGCRMNEYEQESGQMVVDKRRFFYHLQLAGWFINTHARYYNEFLLGDKDMFRFAWHALKTRYGAPAKWVTSVGTVSPEGIYCGHSFAQHHPNGSVAFLHGGLLKTIPKQVMKWQKETRGGIFQAYKRSVVDEDHQFVERVGINFDGVSYLPNRPDDLKPRWCTDFFDVRQRDVNEVVPGFEKIFEEIGGYWLLEEEDMS